MFVSKLFSTCLLGLSALTGVCQAAPSVQAQALERRQSDTIKLATTTLTTLKNNTDKYLSYLADLDARGADVTPAIDYLVKEVEVASSVISKLKPDNTTSKEAGEAWGAAFAHTLIGLKAISKITPEAQNSITALDKGWVTLQRYVWLSVVGVYEWGTIWIYGFVPVEEYFGYLDAALEYLDSQKRIGM